jgi:hypothetical protein
MANSQRQNLQEESNCSTKENNLPVFEPKDIPRILLAIRLENSVAPQELSVDLFKDWLRNIPISAQEVKIEAGFGSFSLILIISLPFMLSIYLPKDPSIINIGPITTANLLERKEPDAPKVVDVTRDFVRQIPHLTIPSTLLSNPDIDSDKQPLSSNVSSNPKETAISPMLSLSEAAKSTMLGSHDNARVHSVSRTCVARI